EPQRERDRLEILRRDDDQQRKSLSVVGQSSGDQPKRFDCDTAFQIQLHDARILPFFRVEVEKTAASHSRLINAQSYAIRLLETEVRIGAAGMAVFLGKGPGSGNAYALD